MCTFTPTLFPNCRCPLITTGALTLCASSTRTGAKCPNPTRELLQKRPGTCGPCKQAQVAREKAKAEAENAKVGAGGREDSFVVAVVEGAVSLGEGKKKGVARAASRSGGGKRTPGSGNGNGNVKAAGESKRVTRSGGKAVLPTR